MAVAIPPATPDAQLSKAEERNLGRLEKAIGSGLQTFRMVGAALLEIRDKRLYRETHATFEAYCSERWAMPRSRAYQLMDSAKVVQTLGDPGELANEAQARELASLPSEEAIKTVWAAAETRASETNRPLTAALIRQVRDEVAPDSGGHVQRVDSPTDRLMQNIIRLGSEYDRWLTSKPHVSERNKVKAAIKVLLQKLGS